MQPEPAAQAALQGQLEAGLAALGVPADARTVDRLLAYLSLIERWGRVYNLTAVRDPAQMLVQHLLDSASVVGPLARHLGGLPSSRDRRRVLDVGSGAGLPGVVIALMRPELEVVCLDAVEKKTRFIGQVAAELGLRNLQAQHGRVESPSAGRFDVVVSRAFASLADFASWSRDRLGEQGVWLAMKGRVPEDELAGLPAAVEAFRVEPLQVPDLDAQRCLVWMRPR